MNGDKLTTQNWKEVMNSKEALREIEQLVPDLSATDRAQLVKGLAALADDYDELHRMSLHITQGLQRISRAKTLIPHVR